VSAAERSIDLRKAKAVGEVIRDALRCYRGYPVLFAALTLMVVVPYALIVFLVEDASVIGQQQHGAVASVSIVLLDALLVGPLISALHVHAVAEIGERRQPRLVDVFMKGARVLPVVAAAEIVAGVATALGFVVFIIPGVLLLARWAVVAQAAAIERTDWLGALRRSGELTRGAYLHVLGVVISVAIVNAIIEGVFAAIAGSGAGAAQVLIGIVIETITLSFAALTSAVLFYDLAARKSRVTQV
jgi:hypothetical protein